MHMIQRGALLAAVLVVAACAGTTQKTDTAKPIDDLSDIPRVPPPGALKDPVNDNLNATLWSQTAAESQALLLQGFNRAAAAVAAGKADPTWNALPRDEQSPLPADAPLAIITDIDETVLDSSPFNADLIQKPIDKALPPAEAKKQFDQRWIDWVAESEALPLPGSAAFLKAAADQGIDIFYITNRKDEEKQDTCNNLLLARFPLPSCDKYVLTRNDAAGRPKEKGSRRKEVGSTHRVVVMLGDNLGDFLNGIYGTRDARASLVDDYASWWGERWIMMPNPMYGSWEEVLGALGENDAASPTHGEEQQRRRLNKGRALRAVDWWGKPSRMEIK